MQSSTIVNISHVHRIHSNSFSHLHLPLCISIDTKKIGSPNRKVYIPGTLGNLLYESCLWIQKYDIYICVCVCVCFLFSTFLSMPNHWIILFLHFSDAHLFPGFSLLRWDAYLRNSCPDQSVFMRGKTRTCTGHPMTFLRWTN